MRELDKFVRETLQTSVKVGVPTGLNGVAEAVLKPEYATAVGLMLMSADGGHTVQGRKPTKHAKKEKKPGILKRFLGKF